MTNIYDQHNAAFARISAYVIAKDGERVATIAFKYPADGAGRLYAYVHWLGTEMVRGFAGGGGYDKRTAACADAARKLRVETWEEVGSGTHRAFAEALHHDDGFTWEHHIRNAGFTIMQAV